jgi:hypothetical protein
MVPRSGWSWSRGSAAPSVHGDGPPAPRPPPLVQPCFPRPWGWSQLRLGHAGDRHLRPAPAGMVLRSAKSPGPRASAPRARGAGPFSTWLTGMRTPRARGDRDALARPIGPYLLPARAGMVPAGWPVTGTASGAPRARGGWSRDVRRRHDEGQLLPASAVMIPGLPRRVPPQGLLPLVRGWPWRGRPGCRRQGLLPAPAGIPSAPTSPPRAWSAPRTCRSGSKQESASQLSPPFAALSLSDMV